MVLNGFIGAPAVIGVPSSMVVNVALLLLPDPLDDEHALSVAAPASNAAGTARYRNLPKFMSLRPCSSGIISGLAVPVREHR
ncbi:MAG TPA: hypothetical protein VHY31_05770 [Streptosporangiaceae bacterium]|nr:hypothetical protein [Streptosporangiaceae bacterium]